MITTFLILFAYLHLNNAASKASIDWTQLKFHSVPPYLYAPSAMTKATVCAPVYSLSPKTPPEKLVLQLDGSVDIYMQIFGRDPSASLVNMTRFEKGTYLYFTADNQQPELLDVHIKGHHSFKIPAPRPNSFIQVDPRDPTRFQACFEASKYIEEISKEHVDAEFAFYCKVEKHDIWIRSNTVDTWQHSQTVKKQKQSPARPVQQLYPVKHKKHNYRNT